MWNGSNNLEAALMVLEHRRKQRQVEFGGFFAGISLGVNARNNNNEIHIRCEAHNHRTHFRAVSLLLRAIMSSTKVHSRVNKAKLSE